MRLVAALLSGFLVALSTDAAALVLCERKRKVAAREACRANETQLALTELGTTGSGGADGAAGPVGPAPLHLVDANGSDVGPVVSLHFLIEFVSDFDFPLIQAVLVRAPLTQPALIGTSVNGVPVGKVFYQSANCTGTPLVQGPSLLPMLQVIGDTVFLATAPGSVLLPVASIEGNDATGGCTSITPRGGCCRPTGGSTTVSTASEVATLGALGIVPPLRAVPK